MPASVCYTVSEPIHAVKLADRPGSSLRDPTETLVRIPAGAVVQLEGKPGPSGLVTVIWITEPYSVFFDDLQEKAQVLSATS